MPRPNLDGHADRSDRSDRPPDRSDHTAAIPPRQEGLTGQEVELKLFAPPGAMEAILAAPIVLRCARRKCVGQRLEAVYYDTADGLLARHAMALRVRRSGRRFIQTLKTPPDLDPLRRGEYEAPVPSLEVDRALLPVAEVGAPLDALADAALVPVFSTRIRRRFQVLDLPDAVVELALDEGRLEAGARSEAVSELELELKSGDVGALYELALSLLDVAPLQLGTLSKSERGQALASGLAPKASKARPAAMAPTATVDEAIFAILASCHAHLIANLASARAGEDAEGVHQLRVALRRLRSAISLFRKEIPAPALLALAADSRRLARVLGPARGWDVFLTTTVSGMEEAGLPDIDFAALRVAAAPFREASYGTVRAELLDRQSTHFLLSLGRAIQRRSWRNDVGGEALAILAGPARDLAGRALSRLQRKAFKQGRHFDRLEPEARHALRLTLKKLRYAAEFFLPLHAGDARAPRYLKQMSALQDLLGADNDTATTAALLRDIAASTAEPEVHRAIGAISGWQARDRREAADAVRRQWRAFRKATPFWAD